MDFFEIVKVPIGYLLGWIYDFIPNYGWAIIVFTFVIKLLLLPLGLKQQKSMTKMQAIQPKITELQAKYKDDQQKLTQETSKLYKEYGISPMGGCLPMLIQLPILFALYRVLYRPLTYMLHMSETAVVDLAEKMAAKFSTHIDMAGPMAQIEVAKLADKINFDFFGLDLSANPNAEGWFAIAMIIPVIAAVTTYFSSKVTTMMNKKKPDKDEAPKKQRVLSPDQKQTQAPAAADMTKGMTWMMPIFTLWITATFPSALGLYWIASNVVSILQTIVLNGYFARKTGAELVAQEAQIAQKRAEKAAKYGYKNRKGKN